MNEGYTVGRLFEDHPRSSWTIKAPNGVALHDYWFPTRREAKAHLDNHDIAAEVEAARQAEARRQAEMARYTAKHKHPLYESLHGMSALRQRLDKAVQWGNEYADKCPAYTDQFREWVDRITTLQADMAHEMTDLNMLIEHDLDAPAREMAGAPL